MMSQTLDLDGGLTNYTVVVAFGDIKWEEELAFPETDLV